MNKFSTIAIVGFASILVSACGSVPECTSDELENCGRGSAYAEERTVLFERPEPAPVVVETPPAPAPTPEPAPAPAVIEPEPEPIIEPVQGTAQPVFDERLTK
ncbi:MAG: hypothetical protein AAF569_07075 [Pseudomonadota bacterium]